MTAILPATITSVARLMPSTSDSRQPYRLSNFDFVTESFTLIAGTSSVPFSSILYSRWTPVVVSSETPRHSFATSCQRVGCSAWTFFSSDLITSSSVELEGESTHLSPFSISTPLWISRVTSPPSSITSCGPSNPPLPSGKFSDWFVHHQNSSSVSPFHANTGTPAAAIAAAAWSCVEKMLQLAQRTSAPSATIVSISTAVWIVICSDPVTRTPASGLPAAYLLRIDIRPGISCSAMSISLRPNSASPISATLYSFATPNAALSIVAVAIPAPRYELSDLVLTLPEYQYSPPSSTAKSLYRFLRNPIQEAMPDPSGTSAPGPCASIPQSLPLPAPALPLHTIRRRSCASHLLTCQSHTDP